MSSTKVEQPGQDFKGWRNYLWPIHNYELKKFLPMGLMMMFVLFNYTLMRDTKDVLVITATGSGAEVVSFLKLGGVLPCAVLFMFFYVKMANLMSSEKIFYTLISAFMIFFAVFGFLINPLVSSLHMSEATMQSLRESAHRSLYWPIAAIGNWSFSLFYIMAELWGSVIISMLFWQFANATTKVSESKRFYAFYGLIGNFGLIFSGEILKLGSRIGNSAKVAGHGDGYAANLRVLTVAIVLACLAIMFIYNWMQKNVLTDPQLFDPTQVKKKKEKLQLSLGESFKYIFKSSYLGLILMIVLGYNICINLVELVWKSQVKIAFPDRNDYSHFMSILSQSTGIFTIFFTFIGMNILRRCSWRTAAIVNPIIVLITSVLFFLLLNYTRLNSPDFPVNLAFITTTLVMLTVSIGLVQNVACKGTKYSLFDSTKQMAYIPLDSELKAKGQAAVEVIGGRFGKSGGAMIQAILLAIFGGGTTLLSLTPILGPIVVLIAVLWLCSVFGLSKKFIALNEKKDSGA
jgi:AAA family ATP:ADP antiporter